MAFYRITYADGQSMYGQFDELPDAPPGGAVDEVSRMPDDGESWDDVAGSFVKDVAIAADLGLELHIDKMRRLKYLEAVIIKSGYELTCGLLCEEAQIRGITLGEMADLVMAQVDAAGEVAAELERMEQKAGQ